MRVSRIFTMVEKTGCRCGNTCYGGRVLLPGQNTLPWQSDLKSSAKSIPASPPMFHVLSRRRRSRVFTIFPILWLLEIFRFAFTQASQVSGLLSSSISSALNMLREDYIFQAHFAHYVSPLLFNLSVHKMFNILL